MLELIKGELVAMRDPVVPHVYDQATFLPTVQRTAEPAANHLLIDVRRECRTSDIDCVRRGSVEALCENSVVGQYPEVTTTEAIDVSAPDRWFSPVIDGCCGYSL